MCEIGGRIARLVENTGLRYSMFEMKFCAARGTIFIPLIIGVRAECIVRPVVMATMVLECICARHLGTITASVNGLCRVS
jgi:hypothetical protein